MACYRVKFAVYLRQVHSAVPKSENYKFCYNYHVSTVLCQADFFLPSLQNAVYILNGVVSTRTLRPGHHRWYSCATVPPFALLKRYTKRTLLNCIRATHLHAVALLYIKMWYMLRRNTQTKNWTITAFHLPHYHSLPPTHLVVSILSSCDLYGYFCSK